MESICIFCYLHLVKKIRQYTFSVKELYLALNATKLPRRHASLLLMCASEITITQHEQTIKMTLEYYELKNESIRNRLKIYYFLYISRQ